MRESNPCTGGQWEMGSVPPHRESRARYPRSIAKGRPAGGGPSYLWLKAPEIVSDWKFMAGQLHDKRMRPHADPDRDEVLRASEDPRGR